jgi:hypothetical protein
MIRGSRVRTHPPHLEVPKRADMAPAPPVRSAPSASGPHEVHGSGAEVRGDHIEVVSEEACANVAGHAGRRDTRHLGEEQLAETVGRPVRCLARPGKDGFRRR